MKKCMYLVSGVIVGAVIATAGGAFADQKSLVGKKVTAEYDVVVEGKKIAKGAVIDGHANVPVRPIADALGVDIKVEGKKILMQALEQEKDDSSVDTTTTPITTTKPTPSGNKYMGDTRKSLEESKNSIENNRLKPLTEGRERILKKIERLRGMKAEDTAESLPHAEKQLAEYDEMIARATEELRLVEEALAAHKDK